MATNFEPVDHSHLFEEGGRLYTRPSTFEDYPTLQPAMRLIIEVGPTMNVGSLSRGTPLTIIPLMAGRLVSEPGFEVNVDCHQVGTGPDCTIFLPLGTFLVFRDEC